MRSTVLGNTNLVFRYQVARDIGIPMAKHLEYGRLLRHEFDWHEYVVREELIR